MNHRPSPTRLLLSSLLAIILALTALPARGHEPPHKAPFAQEADPAMTATMLDTLDSMLTSGELKLHSPKDALDLPNRAALIGMIGNDISYRSLTIPITSAYEFPSNLTVIFTPDGSPISYSETLVARTSLTAYSLQVFTNGEMTKNTQVDIAAPPSGTSTCGTTTASAETMGIGAVAGCLVTTLGISGLTAWLIAGACSGSCAVPLTPPTATVCAACIGAFALVGTGAASYAMGCFQYL